MAVFMKNVLLEEARLISMMSTLHLSENLHLFGCTFEFSFPPPKAVLDVNLVKLQIVVYGWLHVRSDLDEVSNTHIVSY